MSSNDIAIRVSNLSKCYQIYETPRDRLKQFVMPRVRRIAGKANKQYFREFWALKDVSFEIKKGETVGIIGRNGSGKSTLLQMICGTLSPTQGTVKVNGKVAALLELGAGFNSEFTGRENVYMAASLYGLSRLEVDLKLAKIIAFADIGDHLDQPVKTYSSGMYVRLAFAVIAHVDADILIIDEALAVGDAIFTQKCMRFIDEFKKSGTIVFVSHDAAAVASVSEEALWLAHGTVSASGKTPDVLELYHQYSLKEISEYYSGQRVEVKRNEYQESELEEFNQISPHSTKLGSGKVEFLHAAILQNNKPQKVFYGDETVTLVCKVKANEDVNGLLIGFTLKDKLGQKIIEENNLNFVGFVEVNALKNDLLKATFEYKFPFLKAGKYFIDLALAEGTQEEHIPIAWVYDAIEVDFSPSQNVLGIISMGIHAFNVERINR